MNTAARMESHGKPGRIHLSEATAQLLIASGKEHWLEKRDDKITAKGKGELQTYWLAKKPSSFGEARSDMMSESTDMTLSSGCQDTNINLMLQTQTPDPKTKRLVIWNVNSLLSPLGRIALARTEESQPETYWEENIYHDNGIPRDEVSDSIEVIPVPEMNSISQTTEVDPEVARQLESFCTAIATLYQPNRFHGMDHASHVVMSVLKMLSRIVQPKGGVTESSEDKAARSFGLANDPLLHFALLFTAYIHDVDHCGATNATLSKENPALSDLYGGHSVAEQNSFHLAWEILMDSRFTKLRRAIYQNEREKSRFRKLVINAIIATDVMDTDLTQRRNDRWKRAFGEGAQPKEIGKVEEHLASAEKDNDAMRDFRATVVMETLIQAADVAHTMQHWS